MKSKGGSLYEVLKSASRPGGAEDASAPSPETPAAASSEGAPATLQERLAAYKAAKLAAATQQTPNVSAESAPAKPAAATLVLEPDPLPAPAPARALQPAPAPAATADSEPTPLPAPSKGPGERVIRLTYNTALFSGMVLVGLLFIAYAVGLHVGKTHAAAELQSAELPRTIAKAAPPILASPAPIFAPPPAPPKQYSVRLGEWKFVSSQDRVKALALADDPDLKKALERAGHRSFRKEVIKRGNDNWLALYVDSFSDVNSDAARATLTAMKTFKFKSQTPFAQAAFEEAPAR
jgi:hypothetical protein